MAWAIPRPANFLWAFAFSLDAGDGSTYVETQQVVKRKPMTNHQNRRRWAIDQQKKARTISTAKREAELTRKAEVREFQNMFFGNMVAAFLREGRNV
jgi:hypothetical protein